MSSPNLPWHNLNSVLFWPGQRPAPSAPAPFGDSQGAMGLPEPALLQAGPPQPLLTGPVLQRLQQLIAPLWTRSALWPCPRGTSVTGGTAVSESRQGVSSGDKTRQPRGARLSSPGRARCLCAGVWTSHTPSCGNSTGTDAFSACPGKALVIS